MVLGIVVIAVVMIGPLLLERLERGLLPVRTARPAADGERA